jgi:RNA polymerase sigma-70 factor (ECF subfamily)
MSIRSRSGQGCLLRRTVAEPRLFERFYDEHATAMVAFLARRTLDVEVARDLTAETFAQAFRSRGRFRGKTDAEAAGWLYGIGRNLLSHYARTGVVERKAVEKLGVQLATLDDDDYARVVELAGLSDVRALVAAEFGRLQPDQQEAVRLRIVDELSYPEVAERLRISEPTARARVSRGLRRLAEVLEEMPSMREAMT